ncbi:DNA/RNA non-specific endonuclease [Sphingomonas sp. GC_Shp_3]|uniref:DNA/RNA non-specific endonuclease n=1 Tax=Sphingomonas sp. GC_Shp_3 TaxID=2937383 RepID=UPI0022699C6D|nr:DNA/RNA non-specific endonuclease [Sphingomonas sp. GC_Shp_3]
MLAPGDPRQDFGTGVVQYPETFWKVVAVSANDSVGHILRIYAFLLSQKDVIDRFGIEFAPGEYARYQIPLAHISELTGVIFDPQLLIADTKPA